VLDLSGCLRRDARSRIWLYAVTESSLETSDHCHAERRLTAIDPAVNALPRRSHVTAERATELDDPWQARSVAPPTIPREQDPSSSRLRGLPGGVPGPQVMPRLAGERAGQDQSRATLAPRTSTWRRRRAIGSG
jgi:hypothetical protein